MQLDASIFKAYDIRGVVPATVNESVAEALGRAFGSTALAQGERTVAVGRDGRLSGPALSAAQQTARTIGPCRWTRASNAVSSRRSTKRARSSASVNPSVDGGGKRRAPRNSASTRDPGGVPRWGRRPSLL